MLARALIVLLSVLNLGAAAWWITRDPPAPPPPARTPAGVARLQLVSERPAPAAIVAAPAAVASNEAVPPTATATPSPQQCFSFGPFASRDAGAAAAAKLKPLVQSLASREEAAGAARGWRVYLPALASPEQARAEAERIGAAGFSDFLVVRDGAEANSIALGRYSSEAGAKKRAESLKAAGFAAQVAALGEATETWLDVVADGAFDPRRAQAAIAAAQHRKVDCPRQR
jgi:sporulation related protein